MQRLVRLVLMFALLAGFAGAVGPAASAQSDAGAVEILLPDGSVAATVTVDGIAEPFEDYDTGSGPDRGMHFVLVTMTVTNDGEYPFTFDPYSVNLVDSDGFIANSTWIYRSDSVAAPDFDGSPIEPGDSQTGAIGFSVFDGATADLVYYQPSFSRLVILAEQSDGQPAVGDAVPTLSSDGNESLVVTVDEVTDDIGPVYPGYEAQRGYSFVQVVATIENPTARPVALSAFSFGLVDEEGFLLSPTSIWLQEEPVVAELGYDPVPAGETVTGTVTFQVYDAASPARVVFMPDYTQHFTVALLDPEFVGPVAPAGNPGGGAGGGADVAVDPACADVADWYDRTDARGEAWSEILFSTDMPDDPNDADPAALRELADSTRAVIEEQEADVAPDLAADYEAALLDDLEGIADGLDAIATAIENGEDAAEVVAGYEAEMGALEDALGVADEALATACNL